ncbi:adenine phosphoribosyltransferase [Xanthomonas sp. 1678]|uniref:adenine phosphoribosyltransferase n=1 Tax=Xanthomonas sp. 1678 TaxID=3158788 RepID=UPI00286685A8|nr:adenine phosphoribosyltransferase [Xanthomonas translucens]
MNESSCCDAPADAPAHWSGRIRDVADFPKPGIMFKDITPLLADGPDYASAIDAMVQPWRGTPLDAVLGIESRGFILGATLAHELRVGFVPVRKPGKLPTATIGQDYGLEYGRDRIEIHVDALQPGARVLIVDDVLATGGTLLAALALAQRLGAEVVAATVMVELTALGARARWPADIPLTASLRY